MSDVKPRVIHDPDTLRSFAKEARFMGEHTIDFRHVRAYRFMAWACENLASSIEGRHAYNPVCRVCDKPVAICKDGTFRTHSHKDKACKGSGSTMLDQATGSLRAAMGGKA